MSKKKKGKRNPGPLGGVGEALMVINPGNPGGTKKKKPKRNPFRLGSGKGLISGLIDKQTPLQLGGLGGGAFSSRYLTAKILKAKDVGFASVGVQGGVGFLGGVLIKSFLPRFALLGRFFFLGSIFHASWRTFTTNVLSKNLVDGFQYGDVLLKAPPAAPVTEEEVSGLYEETGEEELGGVEEGAYDEAY